MFKRDDRFKVFVETELLKDVDGIRIRRMFDGHGIYQHGVFIGLINGGTMYLKADAVSRKEFEEQGSKPFVYTGHTGKAVKLSFWEVPGSAMDDPAAIIPWIVSAYDASIRSKKKKKFR